MDIKKYQEKFAGQDLSVEVGRLANQANGSVFVQYGKTAVLVTATMSHKMKDVDYMPLTVDYEEKYYAAGKIKGSKWIKRESRPSEEAILAARVIDRSLRPRFDHNIRNEMQVVTTVLSFDGVNDPDMVALFGASLAFMISDIPFDGPVAGVRVGRVDGKLVVNPNYADRIKSDFDVVVAGSKTRINMLEAGANIVPEKDMAEAIEFGFAELQKLNQFQEKVAKEIGKEKKHLKLFHFHEDMVKLVNDFVLPKISDHLSTPKKKKEYYEGLVTIQESLKEHIAAEFVGAPDASSKVAEAMVLFDEAVNKVVHTNILESDKRVDGRKLDELRDISVETAVLPHSHGTGLFNRGDTQALSVLTLGSPGMEQWVETMEIELTKKRFMHHYVFPPFSVGEVGRIGGLGRREIGHGALAEKALVPLIPSKDDFPYTIRVVSEILGSNGSSSMASVCGSILAMMDGGVPIKAPAAGIAMGLMFDEKGEKYKVLTDIQGPEDHHGDMDFKVAGTHEGVTAIQLDVKVDGITPEIVQKTLDQAKKARLQILEVMTKHIASPRPELSPYAPRVQTIKIDPSKIGAVIGKGGETINKIIEMSDAEIDIEDDGSIFITCVSPEGMQKALDMIKNLTYDPQPGDMFEGKVSRLLDFGAMVEYIPGKEGMVHVSEIGEGFIKKPSDVLKAGQSVTVYIKNIDDMGRTNLTMKKKPSPSSAPRE
jgi:polyribonucleotide nucleotidyltransferase